MCHDFNLLQTLVTMKLIGEGVNRGEVGFDYYDEEEMGRSFLLPSSLILMFRFRCSSRDQRRLFRFFG
jgi:hypothetical protein